MSSMYKEYIEEQLPNRFVYENEHGFLTYNKNDTVLRLEEIYIKPEYRRKGLATSFYNKMEEIGKELKCTELMGSIIIGTNNSEGSMMCLLKNKFKLYYTDGTMIYLHRTIGE